MKRLFYGVLLLHLILWFSCTGSPRSQEVKAGISGRVIKRFEPDDF